MKWNQLVIPMAAALVLGGAAQSVSAQTLIDSCRAITQPGSYKLTTNLSGKSYDGKTCFRITVSNVTLDLGGYTVRGLSGSPSYGVYADGGATLGIKVLNGNVSDFNVGVFLGNTFGAVVQYLEVNVNRNVGLMAGNGAVIQHVRAAQNGTYGVTTGAGAYVSDVSVQSSGFDGIQVGLGSRVVNSWSEFNGRWGIVVDRRLLGWASIYANTTGANGAGGISADCSGGQPQSGGGVFSGMGVSADVNDPYFPNHGPHIVANVPDVYTFTSDGAFLLLEPCKELQAGTIVHESGDNK